MSATDTSEKGLETLILLQLTGVDGLTSVPDWTAAEMPDALAATQAAGSGWRAGKPKDGERIPAPKLSGFSAEDARGADAAAEGKAWFPKWELCVDNIK